jgi:hypothetical protein
MRTPGYFSHGEDGPLTVLVYSVTAQINIKEIKKNAIVIREKIFSLK